MVTAGEFCNRTVYIARAGDSLLEAAQRMRDEHVGSLVVVEDVEGGRRPVGMITDRDLLVRVLSDDPARLGSARVGDVMTRDPIRAWEDDSLLDVLKRMRSYGIRRIPVVDASELLAGIITFDDLVEQVADEVRDLATLIGRERRLEAQSEGVGAAAH